MKRESLFARLICLGLLLFLWGEITPWTWIVAVALLILSLVAFQRNWKPPSRWLTSVVALIAGILIYVPAGTLIGRDPSAALLAILAGLKAYESREEADERTLHLIGLFLVTVLYLFRSDLWTLVSGGAAIAFFLFGLLRSQPAAPSPEIARLWVMRLSIRALPLAVLLFFVVPRLQHSGWWDVGAQGKTGFREAVDPATIESIEQDTTPVLRATWEPGAFKEPIFWRGAVLEKTDGFGWSASIRSRGEGKNLNPDERGGAQIDWILEPQPGRWVFAPEGSVEVSDEDRGEQRQLRGTVESGVWRWNIAPQSRTHLRAKVDLNRERPGEFDEKLLVTPAKGELFDGWVKNLTSTRSRADRVRRLAEKFRAGGFVYTRSPGRMKDVETFLTLKRGFCEHYASATASILRAAGVPARVVVGFLGGEWNPVGRFQIVTRADAHAWVEWLDEKNFWRTLDVTAIIPPADPALDARLRVPLIDEENSSWLERARWRIESMNYDVALFFMNFDLDSQKDLWKRVTQWQSGATILAVLLVLSLIFGLRWRSWSFSGLAEAREIRAYKAWFVRGLEKGWPLSSTLGPNENLQRAVTAAPDESERSRKVVEDYVRFRFGG